VKKEHEKRVKRIEQLAAAIKRKLGGKTHLEIAAADEEIKKIYECRRTKEDT